MWMEYYRIHSVNRHVNHTVRELDGSRPPWGKCFIKVPGRCQLACHHIGDLGNRGVLDARGLYCVARQSFIAPR